MHVYISLGSHHIVTKFPYILAKQCLQTGSNQSAHSLKCLYCISQTLPALEGSPVWRGSSVKVRTQMYSATVLQHRRPLNHSVFFPPCNVPQCSPWGFLLKRVYVSPCDAVKMSLSLQTLMSVRCSLVCVQTADVWTPRAHSAASVLRVSPWTVADAHVWVRDVCK